MKTFLLAAVVSLSAAGAQAQLTNADVRAPAEPFRETVFGQVIEDDWRWMERPERAGDLTAFVRNSSAHTVAQLAALPGRRQLRDRIAAAYRAGVRYGDLEEAGGLLFYRRTDPGAQLAKLVVRDAAGAERILYDPEAGGTRGPAINNYTVSPNGRIVALHTASGGGEVGAIRFIDVASGDSLPDRLEPVWGEFGAVWLDNRTIAYTRMTGPATGTEATQNMRVFVRRLGGEDGPAVLGTQAAGGPPFLPQEFPLVFASGTSDWVLGLGAGARADSRIFVARRADLAAGRPNWRILTEYEDRVGGTALIGDRLFLLSTKEASNGRVLMVDLAARGTLATATEIMPAGDAILSGLEATRDGLYVGAQTDGLSRLFYLADGRGAPREVGLPLQGLLASVRASADGSRASFQMQDWFTAPRFFALAGTRTTPLGLESASYAGIRGATQLRETATSADGTQVPMAILLPVNARRDGSLPMLLEGYGSYGVNVAEPYYATNMFGLIESGGAVAFCGTRGGGERGRAWHEAGRAANKPNAHADLIACAERLIALRLTSPQRLTLLGTSAGGQLAPPVALRRPDLFTGLVANVAILNPTRYAAAANGPNQYGEFGDPNIEAGYRGIALSDAYRMLLDARDMPDTLLTIGLNDRRVDPWMSAKFAARALARFGASRLVLIRTDPEAGHGIGSARDQQIEQQADIIAFVLSQAGAEGFTAP